MNTQLSGPKHARADVGRAHRGRSLLAAAAASFLALTGLSGIALASDEDETPTPSTPASSSQIGATEGASSDETQPTGDAGTISSGTISSGTISSGTAGASSAAPEESAPEDDPSATADPEVPAASESEPKSPSKAPTSIQTRETEGIQPLVVGVPDGGTAPYVYWNVKDTAGNFVPGATFKFEYLGRDWSTGTNANAIGDCTGTCSANTSGDSLDRDADGGEWLLEHQGTVRNSNNRLAAGSKYRVRQVTAPAGYQWAISGPNTKTIGANANSATWNNGKGENTHNFGTFVVEKVQTAPVCQPGYIYAVSASGQLQQIAPGRTVTAIGTAANGVRVFNGLGIGAAGQPVYAVERSSESGTSQNGTVYSYDTATGIWTNTGSSTTALGSNYNTGTNLVGGAVDFSTGLYYFGGFTSNGNFKVYEYNPSANPKIKLKGTVVTTADSSANGDIAFDAAGNFYVVRGSGNSTTIYSVTSANFAVASGGIIPSSASEPVDTTRSVNGVAFDSTGRGFLGSSTEVTSFAMPGWTGGQKVSGDGLQSTDLASCSSPPTVVIEKEIVGGRAEQDDQFQLSLNQGQTVLGTATTSGDAVGVQEQRIGPLPTVRNVELTFSEMGVNGAILTHYSSAYQCTVTYSDGTVENLEQRDGTSGSITIPPTGDAVRCVIRNSPLIANVTITKQMQNISGQNPVARSDWTVGASVTETTGSVTSTSPDSATQKTGLSGSAAWNVTFGSLDSVATVAVHEEQQSGYGFVSGSCTVTKLSGDASTTNLAGPEAQNLAGVRPGDQVNCTYTNKPDSATLTLVKTVTNTHGGSAQVSDWTLSAAGAGVGATTISGKTGDLSVTGAVVPVGSYTLSESGTPAGYQAGSWSCTNATVTGDSVSLTKDADATCTITNSDLPGSVTWSKTDTADNLLAGSVWTLTGPKTSDNEPGPSADVEDCVAGSGSACTGRDKNPVAGEFSVIGLSWGTYTLVEKAAPPGYVLDPTQRDFTIKGDALSYSFGAAFRNSQVTPPSLPLTGGLGTDTFLLAGGGLLALAGIGGWIHRRRSLRVQRA